MVGIGEIPGAFQRCVDEGVVGELFAVVVGERVDASPVRQQGGYDGRGDGNCALVGGLEHEGVAAAALDDGDERLP